MKKLKCGCTFFLGFSEKECKYHKSRCHYVLCKKKGTIIGSDGKRYCKEHVYYPDSIEGDPEGFGGRDF